MEGYLIYSPLLHCPFCRSQLDFRKSTMVNPPQLFLYHVCPATEFIYNKTRPTVLEHWKRFNVWVEKMIEEKLEIEGRE